MSLRCFFGHHDFHECRCVRCGETRHRYVTVREELFEGDGCCWDGNYPCTGPHCGTFCENYYRGRAGKRIVKLRCERCGHEETREEPVEYRNDTQ